jgi:ABC-type transport system involved in multi-copper enzyme maturation permease subunit
MADPSPLRDRLSAGEFLAGTRLIAGRELGAYFDSPIAYIVGAVFLVLSCSMFMNGFFLAGQVDMTPYFQLLPFLLIPFVPAITMRLWAEERSLNTFELIMTLPLHPLQIAVGKYVAASLYYAVVLLGSLPIVVMLLWLGEPDLGTILSGYVGALLLGAVLLAAGLFASGLTRDQIVAFVLAALIASVLVLSGHEKVVEVLDGLAPRRQIGSWLHESVSVMPRYEAMVRGLITLADLVYFALMIAFFVAMNHLTLGRRQR